MTETFPPLQTDLILVLPLGATEQHGPHLPFETDAIIAAGIVERVKRLLPPDMNVRFLPVEDVGYSPEHLHAPGTKSRSFIEAVQRWVEIGEEAWRGGCRKFVMLNAHGGNSPLMTIVTTELRMRHQMLAVATGWTRFGYPGGLVSQEEAAYGIHGGLVETSVMLALRPDLVDMSQARNFASTQSRFAEEFTHLRAYGPHAFGWKMSDLSTDGVVGDAAAATAQAGERIIDHAARGFLKLLEDIARFDTSLFS